MISNLESEAIEIIREAVAGAQRPVMLYSIGKDSSVMLHLAQKAFFPALPPFPLLHVDTTWKFQDMYAHRGRISAETGMLRVLKTLPANRLNGSLATSPDGRYLAAMVREGDSIDSDILLLDTRDGREVMAVARPGVDMLVGWAPSGNGLLFTSQRGGSADLWTIPVVNGRPGIAQVARVCRSAAACRERGACGECRECRECRAGHRAARRHVRLGPVRAGPRASAGGAAKRRRHAGRPRLRVPPGC